MRKLKTFLFLLFLPWILGWRLGSKMTNAHGMQRHMEKALMATIVTALFFGLIRVSYNNALANENIHAVLTAVGIG